MFQALGNLWKRTTSQWFQTRSTEEIDKISFFHSYQHASFKQISLCLSFSWYALGFQHCTLSNCQGVFWRLKGSRKKCYYMWYKLGILRIGVYLSTHFIYHTIHDTCICNVHLWYCDQIVHKNINFLYFFKTKGMKVFRK